MTCMNLEDISENDHHKNTWLNITLSQLSRTFLKVSHNITFVFKVFTTQTTAKLFVVRVYRLMRLQFIYCIETL